LIAPFVPQMEKPRAAAYPVLPPSPQFGTTKGNPMTTQTKVIRTRITEDIEADFTMMGFKTFYSTKATIAGIETAHMIRKGQLSDENIPAYKYLWI
jgi:hypothetical protein